MHDMVKIRTVVLKIKSPLPPPPDHIRGPNIPDRIVLRLPYFYFLQILMNVTRTEITVIDGMRGVSIRLGVTTA